MPDREVKERMDYARSTGWDYGLCAKQWGITRGGVIMFLNKQQEYRNRLAPPSEFQQDEGGKPVYENQPLFDLQVLTKEEWCKKWDVPLWDYEKHLRKYERQCGEKLATPERREQWMREYWANLG